MSPLSLSLSHSHFDAGCPWPWVMNRVDKIPYIYIYIYAITEEVLSFIDPNCILNNINFYTNILILTIDVQN